MGQTVMLKGLRSPEPTQIRSKSRHPTPHPGLGSLVSGRHSIRLTLLDVSSKI